jgi:hypothetical protein
MHNRAAPGDFSHLWTIRFGRFRAPPVWLERNIFI